MITIFVIAKHKLHKIPVGPIVKSERQNLIYYMIIKNRTKLRTSEFCQK